jgi:hypothetical protein
MIERPVDGVKQLTLSYISPHRNKLACAAPIVQIHRVRWLPPWLVMALAASAAAAPRSSNPAFLGIQMQDAGGRGPCMIEVATRESPAEAAGLRAGDVVLSLDGKGIGTCAALLDEITAHAPGDVVAIKVQRLSNPVVAKVTLTTRDQMLRRVIGKPMVETELVGVEDRRIYDLSALGGQVAIVGLYNPQCVDCGALFGRFADWARGQARLGRPAPLVLAVTTGEQPRDLAAMQKALDVPLAIGELATGPDVEDSPFGRELVISDRDRLGMLVIDGRGIVQYIAPIAPNSDDMQAVLDELFAAADEAVRRAR